MSNALNMTISHFEKLHETSSSSVNVDGLKHAREHLANADLGIKQMSESINESNSSQENLNRRLDESGSIIEKNNTQFNRSNDSMNSLNQGISQATSNYSIFNENLNSTDNILSNTRSKISEVESSLLNISNNINKNNVNQDTFNNNLNMSSSILENTKSQILELSSNLINMSNELRNINNTQDGYNAKLSQAESILSNTGDHLNSSYNQISKLDDAIKSGNISQEQFNHIIENTNNTLTITREKLSDADTSIKQMGESINLNESNQGKFNSTLSDSSEMINRSNVSMNSLKSNIDRSNSSQKGFNNTLKSTDSIVRQITNRFSTIYILTKAIRELRGGFNLYKDYSGMVAELEGVTGATKSQIDMFKQLAHHLGTTTMYGITEVIDGMTGLSRGGLNVGQVFESIPHVVNFATASGMGMNDAGKVLINTMKGFNLTGKDSQRIMDVIAHAGNTSTAEISEMGQSFREVSAVAEMFNVSLEETAVLLKATSPIAVGSRAGRMVREGISRLGSMRKPVVDMLDQLGVEVIDSTTNELNNIGVIISDINNAFDRLNLSKTAKGQALEQIFGVRNKTAWMEIVEMGSESWDSMLSEMENSSENFADNLANIMLQSTEGTMALFKNQMEGVWISFYESLAGSDKIAEIFQNILRGIITVFRVTMKVVEGLILVLGTLADIFVTLLPLIGSLALAYGILNAQKIANLTVTKLQNAVEGFSLFQRLKLIFVNIRLSFTIFAVTVQTQGLAAAMWTLPLTWILAGFVILIGLLYTAVAGYNKLTGASISATGIIVGGTYAIGAVVFNVVAGMWNLLATFVEVVVNNFLKLKYKLQIVWFAIEVAVQNFVRSGSNSLQSFLDVSFKIASEIKRVFTNVFNWFVSGVQSLSIDIPDWIPTALGGGKSFSVMQDVKLKEYEEIAPPDVVGFIDSKLKDPKIPVEPEYIELKRFEYKNIADSYQKGYGVGEDFANKVRDFFDFGLDEFNMDDFEDMLGDGEGLEDFGDMLDGLGNALPEMLDPLDGISDSLNDIKGDTKSIDKTLTKDDLQYLIDIGTRKAIERHTSEEVNIEIVNYNDISSDMDVDGVINTMVDGLEEYILIGRDGA